MNKDKIIELIERNPSINRNTSVSDIRLIDTYLKEIYNKGLKSFKCHTCVLSGYDKLRVYVGYAPTKKKEFKNIIKNRLNICYTCPNMVKNGLFGIADQCSLCGCSIRAKAELRPKLMKLLGGCPADKWDILN